DGRGGSGSSHERAAVQANQRKAGMAKGTRGCNCSAPDRSPRARWRAARVSPQPGQGIPSHPALGQTGAPARSKPRSAATTTPPRRRPLAPVAVERGPAPARSPARRVADGTASGARGTLRARSAAVATSRFPHLVQIRGEEVQPEEQIEDGVSDLWVLHAG